MIGQTETCPCSFVDEGGGDIIHGYELVEQLVKYSNQYDQRYFGSLGTIVLGVECNLSVS